MWWRPSHPRQPGQVAQSVTSVPPEKRKVDSSILSLATKSAAGRASVPWPTMSTPQIVAVAPLDDVQNWARSNLLIAILAIVGAVLLARFVGWLGQTKSPPGSTPANNKATTWCGPKGPNTGTRWPRCSPGAASW